MLKPVETIFAQNVIADADIPAKISLLLQAAEIEIENLNFGHAKTYISKAKDLAVRLTNGKS